MKLEEYVYQDQKRLRCGYTTGSCAAAAAKAAAQMILTNKWVNEVELCTPKGIRLLLPICRTQRSEASVSCAVQKDSGDDPDVTDGILVFAEVSQLAEGIVIEGGEGIGRVTRPGLALSLIHISITTICLIRWYI